MLFDRRPPKLTAASFFRCHLCCSFLIPPPQHGKRRQAVCRHPAGTPEPVPTCRAQRAEIPLRHDVVVPEQNAIERLGSGHEILSAWGEDDVLYESIYGRVLDPDQIARAGLNGRTRAPVVPLLTTRRQRLQPI